MSPVCFSLSVFRFFAATPQAEAATITACVANQNGTVRFVASPSSCIPGLENGATGSEGATGATGATGPAGTGSLNNNGIPFVTSGHVVSTTPTSLTYFSPTATSGNTVITGATSVNTDTACTASLKVYSYTGVVTTYTLYAFTPTPDVEAQPGATALATYTTSSSTPFTLTGDVAAEQAITIGVTESTSGASFAPFYTKLICQ